MKKSDLPKFLEIITALGELYDKQFSEPALGLYFAALERFPIERIEEAAANIIQRQTFHKFPLPAEFIQFLDPPESMDRRVAEAILQIENGNPYRSLCFDDPILHYVIEVMGGWVNVKAEIRPMGDKEFSFWRNNFGRIYRGFAGRPPDRDVPKLLGIHEVQNRGAGWLDDDGMLKLRNGDSVKADFIDEFIHDKPQLEAGKEVKFIATAKRKET